MITESQIKAALKRAATSPQKSIELADDGERGSGRLVLIIRRFGHRDPDAPPRVGAEWYAKFYEAGARRLIKIGPYPTLGLSEARATYRENYAPKIATGQKPPPGVRERRAAERAAPTVQALFNAYVASLRERGSPSADGIKKILDRVATDIGTKTPAAQITPDDITPHLSKIFKRGSPVMARDTRQYISAAFNWGLRSPHSYKDDKAHTNWGISVNPAAAIPHDATASTPGTRVLSEAEFALFWRWCENARGDRASASGCLLLMATGQRSNEIIGLGAPTSEMNGIYDVVENMIDWTKTKNNRPHAIPLPDVATDIMKSIFANRHGIYFPRRRHPTLPAIVTCITQTIARYLALNPGHEHFNARDIRRTWKTMAGRAGLSKEIRDRLQNHSKADVSSKHYDRYDYLSEKRAAMMVWNAYLVNVLAANPAAPAGPLAAAA